MTFVAMLGESGHGKSTIINALRDQTAPEAVVGKNPGGITREIASYPLPQAWQMQLIDTPGFGCRHMPIHQLIADLESLLASTEHGVLQGIAVTCPVDSPRLMLGTHVVKALMTLGVQGDRAWDHVILLGTKSDRASEDDLEFFRGHLVPAFFDIAPEGTVHRHAVVNQSDCSEFLAALRHLPPAKLLYKPPDSSVFADHLANLLGEEPGALSRALAAARAGDPGEVPLNIVVIGECGDGKSTLINALRDTTASAEQAAGKDPRGVTKEVKCVTGMAIQGRRVNYFDTPGIGDMDVSAVDLCIMLEHIFQPDVSGGIDGLIVTAPVTNKQMRLGGQIVQLLVDLGCHGEHKWSNVILAGTKADRADANEVDNFKSKCTPAFFGKARTEGYRPGQVVLCAKGTSYDELKAALLQLPDAKIAYQPPDAAKLSQGLGQLLGVDASAMQADTEELRRLSDLLKRQKQQVQQSAAELAHKERECRQMQALMAAEEGRLLREMQDHESAMNVHRAQEVLRRDAAARQRVENNRSLEMRWRQLQHEKDVMLQEQARDLAQHKQRLEDERRRMHEWSHEEVRRAAARQTGGRNQAPGVMARVGAFLQNAMHQFI
mmetsp:Transcript_54672/g.127881  ORF Transcript_54672/g.127881 Transcript_54672/m.127881 type:complete len:606 (-) Transcript_54672:101-1918(-)